MRFKKDGLVKIICRIQINLWIDDSSGFITTVRVEFQWLTFKKMEFLENENHNIFRKFY